jgi:hypothetical protein
MTTAKYSEPNKALEDLYRNLYLRPQTINESVSTDEDSDVPVEEGDDGLGIESEFDDLFESILGPDGSFLEEEFDGQTEVDPSADPQVSPQDDLSEFDDAEGGEGEEEEMVSIPVSQLRPLYDLLQAHFGGDEGDVGDGVEGEEDILPADDENNFSNDDIPTEGVAPVAGKKLFDSKKTEFKSRQKTKKPVVSKTNTGSKVKPHNMKSKHLKPTDKTWV